MKDLIEKFKVAMKIKIFDFRQTPAVVTFQVKVK
jgi:hypothetical protein